MSKLLEKPNIIKGQTKLAKEHIIDLYNVLLNSDEFSNVVYNYNNISFPSTIESGSAEWDLNYTLIWNNSSGWSVEEYSQPITKPSDLEKDNANNNDVIFWNETTESWDFKQIDKLINNSTYVNINSESINHNDIIYWNSESQTFETKPQPDLPEDVNAEDYVIINNNTLINNSLAIWNNSSGWATVEHKQMLWGNISGSLENQSDLTTAFNSKVDKELGKVLSSNDYTTEEKNKLNGIEDNANNYTISKEDIESVLTGEISSHTHAGGGSEPSSLIEKSYTHLPTIQQALTNSSDLLTKGYWGLLDTIPTINDDIYWDYNAWMETNLFSLSCPEPWQNFSGLLNEWSDWCGNNYNYYNLNPLQYAGSVVLTKNISYPYHTYTFDSVTPFGDIYLANEYYEAALLPYSYFKDSEYTKHVPVFYCNNAEPIIIEFENGNGNTLPTDILWAKLGVYAINNNWTIENKKIVIDVYDTSTEQWITIIKINDCLEWNENNEYCTIKPNSFNIPPFYGSNFIKLNDIITGEFNKIRIRNESNVEYTYIWSFDIFSSYTFFDKIPYASSCSSWVPAENTTLNNVNGIIVDDTKILLRGFIDIDYLMSKISFDNEHDPESYNEIFPWPATLWPYLLNDLNIKKIADKKHTPDYQNWPIYANANGTWPYFDLYSKTQALNYKFDYGNAVTSSLNHLNKFIEIGKIVKYQVGIDWKTYLYVDFTKDTFNSIYYNYTIPENTIDYTSDNIIFDNEFINHIVT